MNGIVSKLSKREKKRSSSDGIVMNVFTLEETDIILDDKHITQDSDQMGIIYFDQTDQEIKIGNNEIRNRCTTFSKDEIPKLFDRTKTEHLDRTKEKRNKYNKKSVEDIVRQHTKKKLEQNLMQHLADRFRRDPVQTIVIFLLIIFVFCFVIKYNIK